MSDSHANGHSHGRRTFEVRVLRQDSPERPAIGSGIGSSAKPDMNVTSVLQRIAAQAETVDGEPVAPVAYDSNCLEEVCGTCTMLINGRVRQACSALVDKLLAEQPEEIELRPMSKFPVVRDLWSIAGGCSGPGKAASLDSGRRLLRHGPRPAPVARAAGAGLSAAASA